MQEGSESAPRPPQYQPGDWVVSHLSMGEIESAFWMEDQWNYNLKGEMPNNTDKGPLNDTGSLLMGRRYVPESRIQWFWNGIRWQEAQHDY